MEQGFEVYSIAAIALVTDRADEPLVELCDVHVDIAICAGRILGVQVEWLHLEIHLNVTP